MQDFRQLLVWSRAHELALAIYRTTARFPREELYGLTSQTRRASTSVPANIAEGCGIGGDQTFARHLHVAMGSACELEYHLLLARDLNLLNDAEHDGLAAQVAEIKKMLTSFIKTLKADS
jgi:four helix bundle protein